MASPVQTNPPVSPEIATRIEAEMTRILYRSQATGLIVNGILPVIMVIGLGNAFTWGQKGTWLAVTLAATLTRAAIVGSYTRSNPTDNQLRKWRVLYIIGSSLTAALWGAAGILFFDVTSTFSSLLVVMMIVGLNAGA